MYVLKNNCLTVCFTPLGGAISSIKDKEETEYLWQGDAKYWSGQAPVLFPICGSIREDRAVTESGRELHMPRHGIVRKKDFQIESVRDASICFSISDNDELYAQYPFHFKLYITYELKGNSILVTYRIQNQDKEVMPCAIGGHPGFNCPIRSGEEFQDYQIEFETEETCSVPTPITKTGLIDMEHRQMVLNGEKILLLEHALFHRDAIIFDQLKSRKVRLCHRQNGKGIELDIRDFPYLILWSSANDGPFVAIEPWSGLSTCSDEDDIAEHKRNIMLINPQEFKELCFCITVLKNKKGE